MNRSILKVLLTTAMLIVGIGAIRSMQRIAPDVSYPNNAIPSVAFPPDEIDVTPVSNQNPRAGQILALLKELSSKPQILSGNNIGNASFRLGETHRSSVLDLEAETGETPAILSVDYLWETPIGDHAAANEILTEHARRGGIVSVNMHPGNPFTGGLYKTGTGTHSWEELFVSESDPFNTWRTALSHVGDGLTELQDNGVVVLFRPLHEMNGNWFWWSHGGRDAITSEEFQRLWVSVYEYLIVERQLKNLLWVFSPNSAHNRHDSRDVLELYPGDEYVDIVALDYYEDSLSQINRHHSIDELLSLGKPFGFAEFGPRSRSGFNNTIISENLVKKVPQASFLIHWHTNVNESYPPPLSIFDNASADVYMASERVMTRRELATALP